MRSARTSRKSNGRKRKNTMTEQTIKATNDTIHDIVRQEIERLGNEADLNHIDVSEVTNMVELFEYTAFNGNIEQWNFDNIESMTDIFNECPLMRKYGSDGVFLKDGWLKNQDVITAARELSELSYEDVAKKLSEAKLEPETVAGILNRFFDLDWALRVLIALKIIDEKQANSVRAILMDQKSRLSGKLEFPEEIWLKCTDDRNLEFLILAHKVEAERIRRDLLDEANDWLRDLREANPDLEGEIHGKLVAMKKEGKSPEERDKYLLDLHAAYQKDPKVFDLGN